MELLADVPDVIVLALVEVTEPGEAEVLEIGMFEVDACVYNADMDPFTGEA